MVDEMNGELNVNNTPRGDLVTALVELIEGQAKAQVVGVDDPVSGAVARVILRPDGQVIALPASTFDDYIEAPRFRRGTASFTSLESLIAHVNRFKDADSMVFACDDRAKPSMTAVLDYHPANVEKDGDMYAAAPRFGRHRSRFEFPVSDEWQAWNKANGTPMGLTDFAAFLEDRIGDVADPLGAKVPTYADTYIQRIGGKERIATPSDLITLSRGLSINENATIKESANLSSGEGQVVFASEHTVDGVPVSIPTSFLIDVPVFRNDALYTVVARLRYRVRGGLVFWYDLYRTDLVFDHAFNEAALLVATETGLPVLRGSPEA